MVGAGRRSWGTGRQLLVIGLGVLGAVALLMMVGSGPSAAAEGEECTESVPGGPNLTFLDGTLDLAEVKRSQKLNGTIGHVMFEDLATDGNHTLIGPNGNEYGPRDELSGVVHFWNVSLCNTGTYDLYHNVSEEIVTQFDVTSDDSLLDTNTVLVDDAVMSHNDYRDYKAGNLETIIACEPFLSGAHADAEWTGDTTPTGFHFTESTTARFYADFDAQHCTPAWSFFWVCAWSDTGDPLVKVDRCAALPTGVSLKSELFVYVDWTADEDYLGGISAAAYNPWWHHNASAYEERWITPKP